MTKSIWTGTCSAIVGFATAAVTAQTPAPPQSASTSSERSIVVTGCLKAAPSNLERYHRSRWNGRDGWSSRHCGDYGDDGHDQHHRRGASQ